MDKNGLGNVVKNKKIIILFSIFAFVMMIVIGVSLGNLIYKCMRSQEQQTAEVNILSLEENIAEKEEENEVLFVELKDKTNVNNAVSNETTTLKDNKLPTKAVDIPYYIKVNTEANVVTVYKKDSGRKLYSTL